MQRRVEAAFVEYLNAHVMENVSAYRHYENQLREGYPDALSIRQATMHGQSIANALQDSVRSLAKQAVNLQPLDPHLSHQFDTYRGQLTYLRQYISKYADNPGPGERLIDRMLDRLHAIEVSTTHERLHREVIQPLIDEDLGNAGSG